MRDIARALDLTPGALYHYFASKADLLYFCQDYSVERLLDKAGEILRRRGPWAEKLRGLVREQVLCMLDELHGSAAHLEFHALPEARLRRIVAKRDRYDAVVRGVIEKGIRAGEFTPCDAKMVSLALLGAVNWTVRWYRPDGPLKPDEIARQFSDYLVRGVLR